MPPSADELPPLEGLDALDEDRAADMLYNRPLYPAAAMPTEWQRPETPPPHAETDP